VHAPFGDKNRTCPPHLGSEISAECRTLPQYVLRSYCEVGSSRLPGSDADIVLLAATQSTVILFVLRCGQAKEERPAHSYNCNSSMCMCGPPQLRGAVRVKLFVAGPVGKYEIWRGWSK
jgi:hypothetical protein